MKVSVKEKDPVYMKIIDIRCGGLFQRATGNKTIFVRVDSSSPFLVSALETTSVCVLSLQSGRLYEYNYDEPVFPMEQIGELEVQRKKSGSSSDG